MNCQFLALKSKPKSVKNIRKLHRSLATVDFIRNCTKKPSFIQLERYLDNLSNDTEYGFLNCKCNAFLKVFLHFYNINACLKKFFSFFLHNISKFSRFGVDGKSCVLRLICELAESQGLPYNGLMGRAIETLFL